MTWISHRHLMLDIYETLAQMQQLDPLANKRGITVNTLAPVPVPVDTCRKDIRWSLTSLQLHFSFPFMKQIRAANRLGSVEDIAGVKLLAAT